MLCTKSGLIWPSGSREETKNVRSLQQTDGWRTTGDKKSSLEPLAKMT